MYEAEAAQPGRWRRLALLGLLLVGLCPGCAWSPSHWSFPFSRGVWRRWQSNGVAFSVSYLPYDSESRDLLTDSDHADLWVIPFMLLFPVAADVALLPVTCVHDALVD